MKENLLDSNNSLYASLQEMKTPSSRAGYNDITRQYLRFSEIKHLISNYSGSILDAGCGNAEFLQFLKSTGFDGKYTGIDVNPDLLKEAMTRFPRESFTLCDIMKLKGCEYDYVIASGIFNYDYGQDLDLVKNVLKKMFSLAKHKAIFNGLCREGTRKDQGAFYIDQWDLCRWIETELQCKIEARSSFITYNFTLSLSRTWS